MANDSGLEDLSRRTGGAQQQPQGGGTGNGTNATLDKLSPVLQEAVADACFPPEVQCALDQYKAAMQALECGTGDVGPVAAAEQQLGQLPVPPSLGATLLVLKELLGDSVDIGFRGLLIGGTLPALLAFVDGLVSDDLASTGVIEPLIRCGQTKEIPGAQVDLSTWLEAVGGSVTGTEGVYTIGQVVSSILAGDVTLLVEGVNHGVKFAARGGKQRAVEEPTSESVITGPREGFVEALRTNTMLIRRRIQSPHLKIERVLIGNKTKTRVDIVYLKDVASPGIVAEVKSRIQRVQVDGILDTGMLEEFIEDQPSSIFPQVITTERPDRAAAGILEGQVVILSDGSPITLLVPVTFWAFLQSSEDYYQRPWVGTFLRWLRFVFTLLALTGPSLYIAITTFHQEMIPTALLLSIAAAREGIPFPALIEVLMLEIFFEALREAGVRLPRPVGQAVSIVGALVIGEAAVRAGLVSAPVVIIVASTGIASFTFPRYNMGIAIRLLRFPMMFLAGTLGLYGMVLGLITILIHMCSLRSFGVPFMQPIAPFSWAGLKDVLIRAPLWLMGKRPPTWESINGRRQARWLKPGPGGGSS